MFGLRKNFTQNSSPSEVMAEKAEQSLSERIAASLPELRAGYAWRIEENLERHSNANNKYVLWLGKINRFALFLPVGLLFNSMTPEEVSACAAQILSKTPQAKPAQPN